MSDEVSAGVSDGVSAGEPDGVSAGVSDGVSDGVSAGVSDGVTDLLSESLGLGSVPGRLCQQLVGVRHRVGEARQLGEVPHRLPLRVEPAETQTHILSHKPG